MPDDLSRFAAKKHLADEKYRGRRTRFTDRVGQPDVARRVFERRTRLHRGRAARPSRGILASSRRARVGIFSRRTFRTLNVRSPALQRAAVPRPCPQPCLRCVPRPPLVSLGAAAANPSEPSRADTPVGDAPASSLIRAPSFFNTSPCPLVRNLNPKLTNSYLSGLAPPGAEEGPGRRGHRRLGRRRPPKRARTAYLVYCDRHRPARHGLHPLPGHLSSPARRCSR